MKVWFSNFRVFAKNVTIYALKRNTFSILRKIRILTSEKSILYWENYDFQLFQIQLARSGNIGFYNARIGILSSVCENATQASNRISILKHNL